MRRTKTISKLLTEYENQDSISREMGSSQVYDVLTGEKCPLTERNRGREEAGAFKDKTTIEASCYSAGDLREQVAIKLNPTDDLLAQGQGLT